MRLVASVAERECVESSGLIACLGRKISRMRAKKPSITYINNIL